jgi:hypothetical protein
MRVGWFAVSQAFLLAAYAQAITSDRWPKSAPLGLLVAGNPYLGFVTSILTPLSVAAAHAAVRIARQ